MCPSIWFPAFVRTIRWTSSIDGIYPAAFNTSCTTWLILLSGKHSLFLAKDNIQNSRWYSENENLTKDTYLRILILFQAFDSLNLRLEVILLPGFDKLEEEES